MTQDWTQIYGAEGNLIYSVPFYESPALEYGPHTLTVTVNRHWLDVKAYIFDFVTINVKNDVNADLVIVDDAHPSVQYGDYWVLEGNPDYDVNGTTHKASTAGGTAQFSFYGTSIEVYGGVNTNRTDSTAIAAFQVDGGETGFYQSINTAGRDFQNLRLYAKDGLSPGQHTLKIDAKTASEFWLDYFIYKPSALPSSTSTSPPGQSNSSSSNKTPTGGIVGGVIGGIAGLSILAFFIFFFYRRRKGSQNLEGGASQGSSVPFMTFNTPEGANSSSFFGFRGSRNNVVSPPPQEMSNHTASMMPAFRIEPYSVGSSQHPGQTDISSGTHSSYSPYEATAMVQEPTQHREAGPLPQKYRAQQSQPIAPMSEHDPSGSSVYTSSDWQGLRSPPPYSNQ
jgi:hypothetical protein